VAAKARIKSAIEKFSPTPTAIIDSGNGVQLLWRLQEPVDLDPAANADVEARNFALAEAFGCDPSTRNVDRIFRLPGTNNLPNKKKLRIGRVACGTKLLSFTDEAHTGVHRFIERQRTDQGAQLCAAVRHRLPKEFIFERELLRSRIWRSPDRWELAH
jgi:hypothetical protein